MNGIQGSVSVFVCVGVCSRTHRAELFWKCHKSWFIVCHWSALFEFDNLNHSHSPRRFPSLGWRGLLEYKKKWWKGPRSGIKMSGLYLQPVQLDGVKGFNYLCTFSPTLHERWCHLSAVSSSTPRGCTLNHAGVKLLQRPGEEPGGRGHSCSGPVSAGSYYWCRCVWTLQRAVCASAGECNSGIQQETQCFSTHMK